MKIKIITLHNIPNFGSSFQAFALNRYLLDQGHDCEIIDYNPFYCTVGNNLRTVLGKLLNLRAYSARTKKYRKFAKEKMKLTPQCFLSFKALKHAKLDADLFLCGGDQLWNEFYLCGRDDAFKLSFTDGKKAAFGTSMGKNDFSEEGIKKLVHEVNGFKAIGLRERSGVELLRKNGISNACHVCDPVFLLSREKYGEFIGDRPIEDKYLFVYLVQSSELLNKAVDYIAKKYGLKVVLYTGFVPKCRCDVFLKDIGPEENLNYLAHADYVLSASFHASAFSSIFHKEFLTLLPGENTNARIEDFLSLIGAESRMVSDESQLENAVSSPVDWEKADAVLAEHIDNSKRFLEKLLQQ